MLSDLKGFPILTERKNMEKKIKNTTGNRNENPAPQGNKWPDELEDVTERLTAIESAREVVTRRNLQPFVFFRIHLEETKVFLI